MKFHGVKKFRVSKNKLMISLLLFACGFIGTLFLTNPIFDMEKNPLPCVIIAAIAAVILAVLGAVLVKEYYMQISEDYFELVKGKKITRYSFTDFAGSNVTRHYMNGIYTGTTREISIREANGKTTKINANNLSKSDFAELVTYLGKAGYTKSHDIEATAEYFNEGYEFRIPNEKIIKANKGKLVKWTVISILLLVVFFGMLICFLVADYDSAGFFTIMIFAGIAGVMDLFMEVIPAWLTYRKVKNLPNRIYVDRYTLSIGNMTLNADSILNILMVPADYTIMTRDMTVITKDNKKYKFCFGKKDIKNKLTYSDYDKLAGTLEIWCIVNYVNFMKILG